MSDKKLFADRRWHDPLGGRVTGHREIPEEEQKENKRIFREHLKKIGVLKDDNKDEE